MKTLTTSKALAATMAALKPNKTQKTRAFFANAGVEAWYRELLRKLLSAMHQSILLHVRAAWRAEEPTIGFAQDANSALVIRRSLNKWGANWQSKFNALSGDVARAFANKNFRATQATMAQAFKAAGFTVAFKATKASIEAYQAVASQQIALIKSIPQQYLKDVQASVFDSVMRGGDLRTLSQDIHDNYKVSYKRAAFIARDQNNKAKAVIENVRRQELDIEEGIWQHSSAGKVPRPTHVAMNGKRFKLAVGMYDSAIGKYVWPGSEPNCRCTSSAVIEGFSD